MTLVAHINWEQVSTGGSPALRVVLVLDPARTEPMARPARPGVEVKLHLASLERISAAAPFLARADMLIVEVDVSKPAQFDQFARLAQELGSSVPLVAASRTLTVADTRRLIRCGAIDVLPLPIAPEDFDHAIEQATRLRGPATAAAVNEGRIVSFLGAVGGIGATALATQAGVLWADTKRVCLIDLDIQFGSAALYLDIKPKLNLVDLIDAGERLDAEIFQTVAAQHSSGLHVIAGPDDMLPLDIITPAAVMQILNVARKCFDIVIIDLPSAWTSWSMTVLSQSAVTILVAPLTVPGIHQARRKLDLMEANGLPSKILLNRVARPMFRTIDLGDTEKILGRKVDFTVANDFVTVSSAIDQGRTLAAVKAKSRVGLDLAEMVAALSILLERDK